MLTTSGSSVTLIPINPRVPQPPRIPLRSRSATEMLASFGLPPPPNGKDRYYTTCPGCSAKRSTPAHRKAPVLGITIDCEGVHFGCNHCGWTGGGYFESQEKQFPAKSPFVDVYDYVDESGELLFQVCRTADKEFPQRRPDGNSGWIWNLGDTRRVLYRLPELIEAVAANHVLFIVEGEKDADRLASLNIPATCNPGGASKWRPEYNEHLGSANVVIVPDNDSPGRAHAQTVAESLCGIASRIRVFDPAKHWPPCPQGGDISDWLDADKSVEHLWEIVESLPNWAASDADSPAEENSAETSPRFRWINTAHWDTEECPRRKWAIHERVPLRQVALFSGEGAIGKSIVELMCSVAHVTGKDWLGSLPEPGGAFYIGCEDDEEELRIRLTPILKHYGTTFAQLKTDGFRFTSWADIDPVLAAPDHNGIIRPTELFKRLYEEAGDLKPKHIGIDTAADVFAGNENDRAQTRQFISLLRRLAIVSDGSVILLSHPSLTGINSGTGISGTTAWHNSVRSRYYMTAPKLEQGEQPDTDLRELQFKKSNYGPISNSITLRFKNGLFLPEGGTSSLDKLAQEQKAEEIFLALLTRFEREGRNVSDKPSSHNNAPAMFHKEREAKAGGLRREHLNGAMRRLFEAGKIHVEHYGRPSRPMSRLKEGKKEAVGLDK